MAPPDTYLERACQPYIVKCCPVFDDAIHHGRLRHCCCAPIFGQVLIALLLQLCPAMGHQLVSDVLRCHNTGFVCLACYCHGVYSARDGAPM